jgi:hypothetical protein
MWVTSKNMVTDFLKLMKSNKKHKIDIYLKEIK